MRLKGLELQGFKSFADKIELQFGGGITGIVGPNGSGKSNIADAIRWVMGEQSAKSLRGGNMQDVIFSGTQKRKPLGFAEVSLIVDNTDKQLPLDFDEVVVTRRLFRSGESEYYINKSSVRLKDVHELFMDTGVGRDGYSMIGQGKIAEIISTKSEDRRTMFEEAAGITKFRYRKEEAERKLAHTRDNVQRVNDIITEIEGQIGPLKIQSEKAKKYLNLRDALRVLEVSVSLENIVRFRASVQEAEEQLLQLQGQLSDVDAQAADNERQTEEIFRRIAEAEQFAEQQREKQQGSMQSLADCKSDIGVLNGKIDGNNDNIKRIEAEIRELNARFDELEGASADEDGGLAALQQREREMCAQISALEEEQTARSQAASAEQAGIEALHTDIVDALGSNAAVRSKISNCRALIQNFEQRGAAVAQELDDKQKDFTRLQERAVQLEQACTRVQNDVAALQKQEQAARGQCAGLQKQEQRAGQALQSKREALRQAAARRKLLQDLENSFDHYSRSVKAVMNEHAKGALRAATLYGTVASLVQVPKAYALAIEVALGGAAQNIVTQSEDDAKAAIAFLKRTRQGRATFLPVSAARGGLLNEQGAAQCAGFLGIASQLVSCDAKFQAVVQGLLGRTAVVDTIENAIAMARRFSYKFRIVTLTGELLAPGGSMSGGSRNSGSGLFTRANEIVELGETIKNLERAVKAEEQAYAELTERLAQKQRELEALQAQLAGRHEEWIKLQADAEHSKTFLQTAADARQGLEAERRQLQAQIEELTGQIAREEEQLQAAEAHIAEMERDAALKKEALQKDGQQRQELAARLTEARIALNTVQKDLELYHERRAAAEQRKQELNFNIEQKQQNIQELLDANEDLAEDIAFKKQQIEELSEELEALQKTVADSEAERRAAQESIKAQQEQLKSLRDRQGLLQQEQGRVESKRTKAETELENTVNRLWEDYELTVSAAEELRQPVQPGAARRITELKDSIRALGNINIDAIEEYKAVGERYEFLRTQRDDLVEAQKNLEQVIADMVAIMREQFAEKFKVINAHFNDIFTQLFGGGRAQLKLTDPGDVLNSGVDIDVQPPGKAVKSMLQLSGGEQAFVSIALLFAILKVRPSPFCVLDEIEAALDDVNVYRFADYLKKFCANSQFIVVTHRRGTMEAANVLYGVTMQEQGVSRLLSLNIDDVMQAQLS